MNRDLARHIATTAIEASTQLTSLLPLLKGHCDPAEYASQARSIASVGGHITREILHPIFAEHPDLETELEESIKKYGKVL